MRETSGVLYKAGRRQWYVRTLGTLLTVGTKPRLPNDSTIIRARREVAIGGPRS